MVRFNRPGFSSFFIELVHLFPTVIIMSPREIVSDVWRGVFVIDWNMGGSTIGGGFDHLRPPSNSHTPHSSSRLVKLPVNYTINLCLASQLITFETSTWLLLLLFFVFGNRAMGKREGPRPPGKGQKKY